RLLRSRHRPETAMNQTLLLLVRINLQRQYPQSRSLWPRQLRRHHQQQQQHECRLSRFHLGSLSLAQT
ncbi:MAG: hypothetical protein ACJARK_000489, partial [Marinobacter psychrophilus]